MTEWFNEREEGESPLREKWHKQPENIFGFIVLGVVGIVWLMW